MSTVINTNMAAIRTHNVYNKNNAQMNAAMTRVATGMKINSAKDGASTWAISEKMRERIRANDQANQNVQNDTALLKTAQGGIGNTIDILKTLKERAINAANDSNMNTDRTIIAEEVRQLVNQIDDNAAKVKFNGRTLLQGNVGSDEAATALTSASDPAPVTAAGSGVTTEVSDGSSASATEATNEVFSGALLNTNAMKTWDGSSTQNATLTTKLTDLVKSTTSDGSDTLFAVGDKVVLSWKDSSSTEIKTATMTVQTNTTLTNMWSQISGAKWSEVGIAKIGLSTSANMEVGTGIKDSDGNATKIATTNQFYAAMNEGVTLSETAGEGFSLKVTDADDTAKSDATAIFATFAPAVVDKTNLTYTAATAAAGGSSLQFFVGGEKNFGIDVTFSDMTASGTVLNLGDATTFANKFLTKSDAEGAIDTIDTALNAALKEQAKLGAVESRLGYTADNLTTMNENL